MPTILTHAVVGGCAAGSVNPERTSVRFWLLSILVPILPDGDVIGFTVGIPYGHLLGHRGFFHSLVFALLLALLVGGVFFWKSVFREKRWWIIPYFFVLAASHGILDAFTNGGLGIGLLSPVDQTRYFAPITPIPVSPLGIRRVLGWRGLQLLIWECVLVWVPTVVLMLSIRWYRCKRRKNTDAGEVRPTPV